MWQRNWLQGERLQQQARYWGKDLDGAPRLLELPTDHARPAVQCYEGSEVEVILDQRLTEGLRVLSQRHGITLYMTVWSSQDFVDTLKRRADQAGGRPSVQGIHPRGVHDGYTRLSRHIARSTT